MLARARALFVRDKTLTMFMWLAHSLCPPVSVQRQRRVARFGWRTANWTKKPALFPCENKGRCKACGALRGLAALRVH
jgi:hypothetical protein